MIDDVAYIEGLIKRQIPAVTVFQQSTDGSDVEIDVQNVPGKPLSYIRLLLSRDNAAAVHRDPALSGSLITTLTQALDGPSDDAEAVLDLRGAL
jgi:hypothetical protein